MNRRQFIAACAAIAAKPWTAETLCLASRDEALKKYLDLNPVEDWWEPYQYVFVAQLRGQRWYTQELPVSRKYEVRSFVWSTEVPALAQVNIVFEGRKTPISGEFCTTDISHEIAPYVRCLELWPSITIPENASIELAVKNMPENIGPYTVCFAIMGNRTVPKDGLPINRTVDAEFTEEFADDSED